MPKNTLEFLGDIFIVPDCIPRKKVLFEDRAYLNIGFGILFNT